MEYYGLTFIGISLFFAFFALICIKRFIALLTNGRKKVRIWIIFYISIFLSLIVRAGSLVYTGFTLDTEKKLTYYSYEELFNTIPYMVYLLSYFLIVWHYIIYYIIAHINLANDRNLFTEDVPNLTKKSIIIMFIIFPLFFIVFILMSILAIFDIIDEWILIQTVSYLNISSPGIILGYYIFLNVKFSGTPYRDNLYEKNTKTILIMCIVWSMTRITSGIIYLVFEITNLKSFIDDEVYLSLSKNKAINIILICVFFISLEIMPIYYSLEHSFSETFIKEEQTNTIDNNEKFIQSQSEENNSNRVTVNVKEIPNINEGNNNTINNDNNIIKVQKNIKDYLINENEIEIGEILYKRKKGLGTLHKAKYKNKNVICRMINFDRLSRYNIENIIVDFEKIIDLNHKNIDIFIGYYIGDDNKIILVYNEYKNGSLYDYVQINKNILSNENKMNIANGIINGINYLHHHKVIHSHLNSRNILLDNDLNPKIVDFGLSDLYEFANLFNKYESKTGYSPPEILSGNNTIFKSLENMNEDLKKIDIYSFGMILWELITGTVPFDIKLSEVKKYVLEDKVRPEVPDNIDDNLISLIRNCWDSEIDKRPNEQEIIQFFYDNQNIFDS